MVHLIIPCFLWWREIHFLWQDNLKNPKANIQSKSSHKIKKIISFTNSKKHKLCQSIHWSHKVLSAKKPTTLSSSPNKSLNNQANLLYNMFLTLSHVFLSVSYKTLVLHDWTCIRVFVTKKSGELFIGCIRAR